MKTGIHIAIAARQRGAALFVGLIMLLLMTMIGITAMQVTLLQERMAGNFKMRHDGFERGETALTNARTTVQANPTSFGINCYVAGNCLTLIDDPNAATVTNQMPWVAWLTGEPAMPAGPLRALMYCPTCSGAALPPSAAALRYYSVAAVEEDESGATKAALQGIYIF